MGWPPFLLNSGATVKEIFLECDVTLRKLLLLTKSGDYNLGWPSESPAKFKSVYMLLATQEPLVHWSWVGIQAFAYLKSIHWILVHKNSGRQSLPHGTKAKPEGMIYKSFHKPNEHTLGLIFIDF